MGRRFRVVGSGATYHVVARGNDRQSVFLDDEDRERFLEILVEVAGGAGWEGYAYCLMGNHFHLAFQTPRGDLPDGMRDVLGRYARWFNRAHRRSGHLFGGRYRAGVLESDASLFAAMRYIARNPVAAGLVADPADWLWGSYRSLVRALPAVGFVDEASALGLFHEHRWRARVMFRHFVEDGLEVRQSRRQRADWVGGERVRRPSVRQLFFAMPPLDATRACRLLGYTHAEIARGAGVTRSAISYRLRSMDVA